MLGAFAVTLAIFAVIATQHWLLARSINADAGFVDAWLALGVSTIAAIASLLPFGVGVLDGSLAATLDRLGATLEQGGIVALLVRAAVTLPLILAAFACYLYLQGSGVRLDAKAAADLEGGARARRSVRPCWRA
jgi:uncharacterized membrane protein YbhN (UPF0104 family)